MTADADSRVTCSACMAYREGRCTQSKAAGLHPDKWRPGTAEIGRTLAATLQHCNGFTARKVRS